MRTIHPLHGTDFSRVMALQKDYQTKLRRIAASGQATKRQRESALEELALVSECLDHLTRYRMMLEAQRSDSDVSEEVEEASARYKPAEARRATSQAAAAVG